ncbi:hypothetical protein [Lactococcus garvieae]|uniref:SLT domain-containing protein n=1 Tax=Lactococcus garvieae TaxID=1363 RepID=A0A1I4J288_9LACT|nr:hypothetical protein [Lactococcus garvieae]SFL60684.1 SLT domain-containing protein [Lactococcus garvieae]
MISQLPHHQTGVWGTITNAFDWVKGKFSDTWSVVSKGATGIIDDIIDGLGLTKFTKSLTNDAFRKMSDGSFSKIKSTAIDYVKKLIDKFTNENSNNSSTGGDHVGSWESQIKKAASFLGMTLAPWQIQNLLKQIQTESGGNEKIVQSSSVVDINTLSGNPAKGLLQFIPQTFAQWALPGHTNIFSGFDQILAAIRRLNAMGTWNYIGQGHGWERGGFISRHGYYELGEGGNEEAIIPLNKGMRSLDMLYKTMNKLGVHREVKVEVPQENSTDKLLPVLLEILTAVKASRNISMNIGGQMIDILDTQLGVNHFQHNRLDIGGGTVG